MGRRRTARCSQRGPEPPAPRGVAAQTGIGDGSVWAVALGRPPRTSCAALLCVIMLLLLMSLYEKHGTGGLPVTLAAEGASPGHGPLPIFGRRGVQGAAGSSCWPLGAGAAG